jgi:hypothetical protein
VHEYTKSGVDLVTAVVALGHAFEQSDKAHSLLEGSSGSQSAVTVAAAELRIAEAWLSLAAAETRFDESSSKLEELGLARVAGEHEFGSAEQSEATREAARLLGRPKIVIGADEESGRIRGMQRLLRDQVAEQVREGDFNEARLLAEAFGPAFFTQGEGLAGGSIEIAGMNVTKHFHDQSRQIETEMQEKIAWQQGELDQIESRERQLDADIRRLNQDHDAQGQDIDTHDQDNYREYARESESLQRQVGDLNRSGLMLPPHVREQRSRQLEQVRARLESRRAAQVRQFDGLRARLERDRQDAEADFATRRAALINQRIAAKREIESLQREMLQRQRDYLTTLVEQFATGLRMERDRRVGGVAPRRMESREWAEYNSYLPQIEAKLRKLIVEPTGHKGYHELLETHIGKHPDFGAKVQNVKVNNTTELARGLLGWVKAKPNRHQEKVIAQKIYKDGRVEELLDVLITRMNSRIMRLPASQLIVRELASGRSAIELDRPLGTYLPANRQSPEHLQHRVSAIHSHVDGLMALLRNPTRFTIRDKIMVLHDLSEYFGQPRHTPRTHGTNLLPAVTDRDMQSTTAVDANGYRTNSSSDRGWIQIRQPDGSERAWMSTRNENAPSTILARERNIPVWAGQSYTAMRMFKLAEWVGGSKHEIGAVAYGIFAFWRLDYDHTTQLAYHTLHEVLDIAQNFGISYTVNDQTATLSMVSWMVAYREATSLAEVLRSGMLPPSARNTGLSWNPDRLRALGVELDGFRRAVDLAPDNSHRVLAIASLLTKLEQVKAEVGIDTSLRSDALERSRTMSVGRRGTGWGAPPRAPHSVSMPRAAHPHLERDEHGIPWASSQYSARDVHGELIPNDQRRCVEVTVIFDRAAETGSPKPPCTATSPHPCPAAPRAPEGAAGR